MLPIFKIQLIFKSAQHGVRRLGVENGKGHAPKAPPTGGLGQRLGKEPGHLRRVVGEDAATPGAEHQRLHAVAGGGGQHQPQPLAGTDSRRGLGAPAARSIPRANFLSNRYRRPALLRGRVSGIALAVLAGSSPGAGFGWRQTTRGPLVALCFSGCRVS